jgi:hypothetical protein
MLCLLLTIVFILGIAAGCGTNGKVKELKAQARAVK